MSHYLTDLFATPLSSAKIIDVRDPANGQSLINGTFVVRVQDGVQINKPTGFSDLITKKYAGLLGFFSGFTRISFDDLTDASAVDALNSSKIQLGQRASIGLYPGGLLQSVAIPLTPGTPSQAVVTWETYSLANADDKNDRVQRTYSEVPSTSSNILASVSFNGGATFNPTTDGAVLNIPLASQGLSFILRLTNVSIGKLFLGSWAVIY